jgi:flagellar hook assembly protein FlgD
VGTSNNSTYYKPLEEDVCDAPGSVIDSFTIYKDSAQAVGVKQDQTSSDSYIRNYPNPFHLSTNISYSLRQTGVVRIEIYDLLGRKVCTLVDDVKEQGDYTIEWIAKDEKGNSLPGGIYIAQICTGNKDRISRLMLMR